MFTRTFMVLTLDRCLVIVYDHVGSIGRAVALCDGDTLSTPDVRTFAMCECRLGSTALQRVGDNGHSLGSFFSDSIVRNWLWSTAIRSCPLCSFSNITASS